MNIRQLGEGRIDPLHQTTAVGAVEGPKLARVEVIEQFEQTRLHLLHLAVGGQLGGLGFPCLLPFLSLLFLLTFQLLTPVMNDQSEEGIHVT